jgi:N-acetyl-beta-hexosaminidase
LGVEGELWTEWIDGKEKLELSLYPRAQALAEVAWSSKRNVDFDSFLKRLDKFKPYFQLFDINYAVDKVSMPKSRLKRNKILKLFFKGNPYYEVELNKEYKSKGAM